MNPISIFPPPTRALSRQNTKSNSNNNNNNNSSTSPLSRFHTHSTDDPSSTSSSNNTTTQSTAGGLLHGRNKSFGTANGLGSSWAPFTSSSSSAADSPAHSSTTASSPQPQPTTSSAASTARKLIKKRTPSSAHTTTTSSSAGAASSLSNSTASLSPLGGSATAGSPAAFMTENILRNNNSSQFTLSPSTATATKRKPTPDIPANLPQTIFFDRLRPTEVTAAHRLERQGYPEEDAASLEKLRYRQAAAPHLFMGAFLPGASKAGGKDTSNSSNANSSGGNAGNSAGNAGGGGGGGTGAGAGPNSTNSYPPRTLIGFITATAALALTLKSMSTHSNSRDARLVCIHSVVVMPEYQRHGLALRMLREYIGRLMRAELGPRGARLAAMAEAKANAEAASAAAATTAAAGTNLAPPPPPADGPTAPVAFADDDLLGEEDDEAELENERSGDRQSRKRGYEAIALLAHEEIMPLYLRAGFRVQGLSHVKYGSGDWYEMRREIVPRNAMRRDESEDSDEDDEDDQGPPTVVEPAKLSREASGGSTDVTPKASNTLDMPLLSSPGQHSQGASGGSSDEGGGGGAGGAGGGGGVTASPPTLNLPKSIDASALLAALTGSSSKANPAENKARTPSSTGITSPPQAPRNPGTPFSTVLGQALAGKTASEDPRSTLEARLVNREEDTNLADLYCPREACNCLLLRADLGVWKARELGPLSAPALQSSGGVLPANSPAPPLNGVVAPLPMRPSVDNHSSPLLFATTGVHQQQQQQQQQPKITMQGATSLRDFWSVPSPFVFDNISFSKDVQWPPKMMGPSSTSSATPTATSTKGRMPLINRGRSNSGSLLSSPPSGPVAGAGAGAGKEVQESISSPTSPGGLRERSQSASASMVLNASAEGKSSGVEEGEGGEGDVNVDSHNRTPGEEKQRALFAQGVEAGAPTLAAAPLISGGVSSESTSAGVGVGAASASASTPQLVSVPPGSTKAHGSRIGGLKLTIGKRKTSLAVPTLGNSGDSSGSTTSNLEGGGGALLSPAAITPSVVSPGTPSWAASVATSGKKGLAAALGRGGKKEKDKEREREKDGAQQQHWSPMVGGSTHGTSSPSTGTSSPGGGGGQPPSSAHLSPGGAGDLWIGGGGGSAAPIQRLSAYGIDPHAYPFNTSSAYTSGSWHMPGSSHPDPSISASSPAVESGPKLTIKYLLCPECDCGPLGYVVISEEMKGGGLARAVAASQGGRDEGGSGGDVGGGAGAGKRKMEYLLAADRVRYRFRASN
ncbi:hypothetical protein A4X13_0g3700 [Tilletia indica]|uniref:N-acetyltransferase domain-containing protein n=1 Tax=Tilletia indica TaxID=43049 RepID=A0A177TC61_9BASI|nr:hypothetical protein A4X13_0g3700 [Tilletia indica]